MKELKSIRIDTAFPEYTTQLLGEALNAGWIILSKTVMDERYIFYLLSRENDPDLGKTGGRKEQND